MFGGMIRSWRQGKVVGQAGRVLLKTYSLQVDPSAFNSMLSMRRMVEYFNEYEFAAFYLGIYIDELDSADPRANRAVRNWVEMTNLLIERGHINNDVAIEDLLAKAKDRFGVGV